MKQLKVFYLVLIFLISRAFPAFSQSKKESHYLFSGFEPAIVYLNTGNVQQIDLNYNTLTEEMVFVKNGQYLALANLTSIDSVLVQKRKFIPQSGRFYEEILAGKTPLYLQNKNKLIVAGKSTGFGATQTSAVDNISNIFSSGKVYNLELGNEYKLLSENAFWVVKNGEYLRFNSMKDAEKAFPEKQPELKQFVKGNKIKFNDREKLIELLVFLSGAK